MKYALILLLLSGQAFAYTSSPTGNERIKDPAWPQEEKTEKREPASSEVKKVKESKKQTSEEKKQ